MKTPFSKKLFLLIIFIPSCLIAQDGDLDDNINGFSNGSSWDSNLPGSDFHSNMSMELALNEPDMPIPPAVNFDMPMGHHSSPFNLTLSTENPGDTILYTVDCSSPGSSATARIVISPAIIRIHPDSIEGRPNTPAVVIRAVTSKAGFSLGHSQTRTFIFTDRIKSQTKPDSPWPQGMYVNQQLIKLAVSPTIANDPRYSPHINEALTSIPSVSLVSDMNNFFDPFTGIYVNAYNRGVEWERPAAFELINTANTSEFSINAGVRIRGGNSRRPDNPKHAFRLFFRKEYGQSRLRHNLFPGDTTAAQEFKRMDLRSTQNYSWSYANSAHLMTYAQDEFNRSNQGLMQQPFTRSRYLHLYLNGLYWGIFEFQERAEANFGESYLGGDRDDYDVIKVDPADNRFVVEATDGNLDLWNLILTKTRQGFTSNTNYFNLQGLSANNKVDSTLQALVDIDNLIDYMLLAFYSANFDSPWSIWGMPNNFYALKNRRYTRKGFVFLVHDAEHSMNYEPGTGHQSQQGVFENRVTLAPYNKFTEPSSVERFSPQWLHHRLTDNSEYRMRFADRAYKVLYNNGLLTPDKAEANFRYWADQLDMAIIAESVKWGDRPDVGQLYNRNDHWIPAVENTVSDFIALRTPILINQLRSANLLTPIIPAQLHLENELLIETIVEFDDIARLRFTNPNASGTMLYTLDGSDPRLTGGAQNPDAFTAGSGETIDILYPLVMKTRTKAGNTWSPVREVLFTNTKNRENLRITEIHYNPVDLNAATSKKMEFIELKNIGDKGIDLGGCYFGRGVRYVFPKGSIINPDGFLVLASDGNFFEYTYGIKPSGVFEGNLDNSGERITLFDENNIPLIDVNYDDKSPWPTEADGKGYSMVAKEINPGRNEGNPSYWRASRLMHGSPFADDALFSTVDKPTNILTSVQLFPNPARESTNIAVSSLKPFKISITHISGKIVLLQSFEENTGQKNLDLLSLGLQAGIYIVSVESEGKLWREKLIVTN
jgi:hypothetical protein